MKHKLINFILFQSIWFILILAAAHESFYGLALGLLLILVQYWHGKLMVPDFKLILASIIIGFAHDTSLNYFKFIQYNIDFNTYYSPFWIIGLWISFALTINHSLAWLGNKKLLQMIFGLIGGPLAYIAGEKLGAIYMINTMTLYVLALSWACITPLLFQFKKKVS
ncbi:MAG: DUF2878 domain-containing protein [Methylophilaceae bacterium]